MFVTLNDNSHFVLTWNFIAENINCDLLHLFFSEAIFMHIHGVHSLTLLRESDREKRYSHFESEFLNVFSSFPPEKIRLP